MTWFVFVVIVQVYGVLAFAEPSAEDCVALQERVKTEFEGTVVRLSPCIEVNFSGGSRPSP